MERLFDLVSAAEEVSERMQMEMSALNDNGTAAAQNFMYHISNLVTRLEMLTCC